MRHGALRGSRWVTTMRLAAVLLLLILGYVPAAALAAPSEGPMVISVKEFSYGPKEATIPAGTTVTWVNQGNERHTINSVERNGSSGHGSGNGKIDSDDLKPGQSYSLRFDAPGTYSYICKRHREQMAGTITVVAPSSSPTPVATPTATPPPAGPPAPPAATPPAPPTATPPAPPPTPVGATVTMGNDFFSPASLGVRAGTTVTWTNKGSTHTVTSNTGVWDSGTMRAGQSFSFTFQNPGTYAYNCIFHGGMVGTIVVTAVNVPPPPPPAATPPATAPGGSAPNPPAPGPATPPAGSPVPTAPPAAPGPVSPPPSASAPAPQPGGSSVSLGDDFFTPASLAVSPGTAVIWTNNGKHPHTVTSDNGLWDSGILKAGQTFSFTFQNPGNYSYNCALHGGMAGTIVVTAAAPATGPAPGQSPAPPPAATPAGSSPSPSPAAPPVAPPAASPAPTQPPAAPPAPAPQSGGATVSLGDDFFSPASLTVSPGATVTWTNNGKHPHTVTSDTGLWDSGTLKSGQSFSFTFQSPGTYTYNCVFHGGMVGTVAVSGGGSAPNPTPVTATPIPTPAVSPTPTPAVSPTPAPLSGGNAVSLGDDSFSPGSLTVSPGTTVTWSNNGQHPHTVTSDTGLFDSGMLRSGQRFSFTFQSRGTYTYNCVFHSGMVGTLVVSGAGPLQTPSPTATAEPSPTATPVATATPVSEADPVSTAAAEASVVSTGDNFFSVASLSVPAGATVNWTNGGHVAHIVASDTGLWDSGLLKPGQSFSFTFHDPGTYSYTCPLHEGMVGTVVVEGAPGQPPADVPPEASQSRGGAPALDSTAPAAPAIEAAPASPGGSTAAAVSDSTVSMLDNSFSPEPVTVPAGTTIIWTNSGRMPHTSTSKDGLWDSGLMKAGQSFSFLFDKTGRYEYVCIFHPDMVGTVNVQGGGAAVALTLALPGAGSAGPESSRSEAEVPQEAAAPVPPPAGADAPQTSAETAELSATEGTLQPVEPAILVGAGQSAPVPAPASGGYSFSLTAGPSTAPMTINLVVPGPSFFEIVVLMAAGGAIVTSLFNLFLMVRPRR